MNWLSFFATVIEILTDPLDLGRVKIRADGVHGPEIADADLPYAQVVLPTTGGGKSGVGENVQMLPGARCIGFFIDGALCQLPIVIGTVPHIEVPTNAQIEDDAESALTTTRPSDKAFQSNTNTVTKSVRPLGRNVVQTVDDRKKIVWEFFRSKHKKYTPARISGIIGNLIIESNIDATRHQDFKTIGDGRGVGRGIAQWDSRVEEGGRWIDLIKFAHERNTTEYGLIIQLEFIDLELKKDFYNGGLFKTTSVSGSTMAFMRNYERPRTIGHPSNTSVSPYENPDNKFLAKESEKKRLDTANAVYREFTESN
tara:strand:+ start:424 stop:1359 length:936 start_codon:yes stop_codon:yes gene_type:complete